MTAYAGNIPGTMIAASRHDTSDEALLLAAQAGDAVAFVELSDRHSNRILHRLHRLTRSWEDAEDALQEALLKAFLHLAEFEGRSKFSTWLTRIAINSALMIMRKRRVRPEVPLDNSSEGSEVWRPWDIPDRSNGPENELVLNESREMLRNAAHRLPPRIRDVVELYYSQDFSMAEVAQTLGISVAAAKSRMLRARVVLRKAVNRPRKIPSFQYVLTESRPDRDPAEALAGVSTIMWGKGPFSPSACQQSATRTQKVPSGTCAAS
jgi:RNA polymerase sigma-70 factor (ECF subfamily)